MALRALVRRGLERLARRVARDALFERPGERAASSGAARRDTTRVLAPDGCVPVDAAALVDALRPNRRPRVVNHWATWCEPCVEELPRLVRAAAGCGDAADFLGVSWDLFDHPGDPAPRAREVAAFADSMGVGYPSVLFIGTPEALFAACALAEHTVPQTLVLATDGRVVWHKHGTLEHDDVPSLVAAVRAAAGAS
jgi:thiol-disulfide isomerase/thioredoxin